MNINKDLVPEDVSKQLNEIGYDGDYWFVSNDYGVVHHIISSSFDGDYVKHDKFDDRLPRPTYFQAFRWFRDNHGYSHSITEHEIIEGETDLLCIDESEEFQSIEWLARVQPHFIKTFKTYEEAELSCLKKLIEIVKGGNK